MSRIWSRLPGPVAHACGRCGHLIAVGDPQLVITGPEHRWTVRRCVTCADEPVPPLIAPLPESTTASDDELRAAEVMGTLQTDVNELRRRAARQGRR